jgi:hypothetical protein
VTAQVTVDAVAVGQQTQAAAAVAGRPSASGETLPAGVLLQGSARAVLVEDVLHIRLDEGNRNYLIPRPTGEIETFVLAAFEVRAAVTAEHAPCRILRTGEALCVKDVHVTGLQHRLFQQRWGLLGRVMRTPRTVTRTLVSFVLKTVQRQAYQLARSASEALSRRYFF